MRNQQEDTVNAFGSTDLRTYWLLVRRRWWIIVLVLVAAMGLAIAYLSLKTPLYTATSSIVREQTSLETVLFGSRLVEDPNSARGLQASVDLVTSEGVATLVQKDVASERPVGELIDMITASPPEDNSLSYSILISAVSPSAREAADVANSFARQFVVYKEESDRALIASAQQVLQKQLDAMSAADRATAAGISLAQRLDQLKILQDFHTAGYVVSEVAAVPAAPFSPAPLETLIVAALMGLVLGLILVFVLGYFDRRIRDEETLEWEFGAPVLASPPLTGRRKWRANGENGDNHAVGFAHGEASLESFRTLRSNLLYTGLGADQPRTVLVTSGLPCEGKTTTAVNLALTLALAGEKVVLVEADLRKPTMDHYLGMTGGVGLSNVLSNGNLANADISRMLRKVPLSTFALGVKVQRPPETGRRPTTPYAGLFCLCLPAGALPTNPAELLGSEKMQQVLEYLRGVVDYVIIDSPPLLLVSDALNLVQYVDGVLLTARLGRTTLDEARSVRSQLDRAGARVLGVVATGAHASRRYSRYGYYATGN